MTTYKNELQEYRPIFMIVTFGFLGFAFYLTYRLRRAPVTRVMKLNKVMLWTATVMAVAFLCFPQGMTRFFTPEEEVTAGMTRTVIQIEGMT